MTFCLTQTRQRDCSVFIETYIQAKGRLKTTLRFQTAFFSQKSYHINNEMLYNNSLLKYDEKLK